MRHAGFQGVCTGAWVHGHERCVHLCADFRTSGTCCAVIAISSLPAIRPHCSATTRSGAYFDKDFSASEDESIKVIKRFRELTGNDAALLDTADVYGSEGSNEKLVGELRVLNRPPCSEVTSSVRMHLALQVKPAPRTLSQCPGLWWTT